MNALIQKIREQLRRTRGYSYFTLLELLIVAAIIIILAALIVPAVIKSKCRSLITKFKGDLEALRTDITGGLIPAQQASDRLRDLIQQFNDEIKKAGCFTDADRTTIIEKLRAIQKEVELKVVAAEEPQLSIWQQMLTKLGEVLN
jgi:type II secretory pathway pseudopilin PulG